MALTIEQEQILIQIIEAFQNGKRISDLPDVKGTNPFDLLVEVLDTDGDSKKATLASLLPYLEEQCSYGVELSLTVSSPTCTRIGDVKFHKSLPVHSRIKGCLLDDDGKVVEYLDPKDWTGQTRDGSRGQVMVEIPLHYRKFSEDGGIFRVRISELPLPGYHQVPKMYISAYEATVQRSKSKLASVVNDSIDFRGGNNNSAWDGTYHSFLGRPASNINRTNLRNYARNRKAGSTEWNCMTYEAQKALYWLFVVEYATLNTQAAYNAELTAEGYRQGGLGDGVTTFDWAEWETFCDYYPFIPCGYTDSLGNRTGIVAYTATNESGETVKTFNVPRYRGIENPFGHIWKIVDGINVKTSPSMENGGDGVSKVFVCSDPAKFNDTGYDGYRHVGNEARNSGYIKEIIGGEYGEIMPAVCSGAGSTTYFCDRFLSNITESEKLQCACFGGRSAEGAGAGLICLSQQVSSPFDESSNIGSRLCFLPA